jgi:hypothetical protein
VLALPDFQLTLTYSNYPVRFFLGERYQWSGNIRRIITDIANRVEKTERSTPTKRFSRSDLTLARYGSSLTGDPEHVGPVNGV